MNEKISILIIGTGDVCEKIALQIKENSKIDLLGVIMDYSASQEQLTKYKSFLIKNDIHIGEFSEIHELKPNFILVNEYRKIINIREFGDYLWINIHAGLLPKYRGFHSNAWAILNGENKIGYTVHEMNNESDAGPILYKAELEIKKNETYSQFRPKMIEHLLDNIENIIIGIVEGKYKRIFQLEDKFVCCGKITSQDGHIYDWNKDTNYIFNLYRAMAKPLGTGLYCYYKSKKVGLEKISLIEGQLDYIGIPGVIVNVLQNGSMWVKTRNSLISVDLIEIDNEIIKPKDLFKINMRFATKYLED